MPIVQFEDRPLLDLGWGHPRADLLPGDDWARASDRALRTYGWQALTYGHAAGPAPLIDWLCSRSGDVAPGQVFVTAGASHALDLVVGALTRPGDVVLVDSPSYHLAFPILADRRVSLVRAPADEDGIVPAQLHDLVERLGLAAPLLYLVPTFANPTGRSLPPDRRQALASLARRGVVTVIEDDTYRELAYDAPAPPSLWQLAGGDGVIRVSSFAKTVAPGLRLGWISASGDLVERLARLGYVHSGGGVNHTVAMTMAVFGAEGRYDRHLARLREEYRSQRDALIEALNSDGLPATTPAGGWFAWLELPVPAARLLPVAERLGVSYVPGPAFWVDGSGGHDRARLSFSRLPARDLAEAAHRLAAAVRRPPTVETQPARRQHMVDRQSGPMIDTTTAHPARRYNYLLGGKDNFQADRESGDELARLNPSIKIAALENRAFLQRAVAFLAEQGIRQFIDIGTGLPTADNTHEVAQRITPEARIVYVDNDPLVLVHARALLTSTPEGRTAYIEADVREPEKIMNDPVLRETVDFSRPVGLVLVSVLPFVPGDDVAGRIVRTLLDPLPSGSWLVLSHATFDTLDPAVAEKYWEMFRAGRSDIWPRTQDEFRGLFAGLELAEPGVVQVHEWRPRPDAPARAANEINNWAAVGRKP
jgi:2-aminoadipate transaminase